MIATCGTEIDIPPMARADEYRLAIFSRDRIANGKARRRALAIRHSRKNLFGTLRILHEVPSPLAILVTRSAVNHRFYEHE